MGDCFTTVVLPGFASLARENPPPLAEKGAFPKNRMRKNFTFSGLGVKTPKMGDDLWGPHPPPILRGSFQKGPGGPGLPPWGGGKGPSEGWAIGAGAPPWTRGGAARVGGPGPKMGPSPPGSAKVGFCGDLSPPAGGPPGLPPEKNKTHRPGGARGRNALKR